MTKHYILSNFLKKSKTFDIYRYIFDELKINHSYEAVEISTVDPNQVSKSEKENLDLFFNNFCSDKEAMSIVVSNPFKQLVHEYCDEIDGVANEMKAVNLVFKRKGRLVGSNIDGEAFIKGLRETENISFKDKSVLILGCGGVSTAVCFALIIEKVNNLYLYDSDIHKAEILKSKLLSKEAKLEINILTNLDLVPSLQVEVIYNGTGVGKYSNDPESIRRSPIIADLIPEKSISIDANYTPWETMFLQDAKQKGCTIVNGFSHMIAYTTLHLHRVLEEELDFKHIYDIGKKFV